MAHATRRPDRLHSCVRLLGRISQAARSAYAAGSFHSRVLDPSSARLVFLSRDPAACSGMHATPVSTAFQLPLDLTAPPSLAAWLPTSILRTNRAPLTSALSLRLNFLTASCSISQADLSLLSSVSLTDPSRFPQSRPCGVLWSAHYPCQLHLSASSGPGSAPDSFAPRCGFQLSLLALTRADSSGGSSACADGTFHSRVLNPSLVGLAFPGRDSAASSGLHATPVSAALRRPLWI